MSKSELLRGVGITYVEEKGNLYFVYNKSALRVPVPRNVQRMGQQGVQEYAEKYVLNDLKKREKMALFEKNPNFPVKTRCGNIVLEGRIVSAENNILKVRLERPVKYSGEKDINFGFASAMVGHYIFSGTRLCEFSKPTIESAQQLLVQIYEGKKYEEKYRGAIKLAEKLNS